MAIAQSIVSGIGVLTGLLGLGALGIELQYRQRPKKQLELTSGTWKLELDDPKHYQLVGELELVNLSPKLAIVIPELSAEVKLFSKGSLEGITCQTQVIPLHPDESPREDGYWFAYLLKEGGTSKVKISVEIQGEDLIPLQSTWIEIDYIAHGAGGRDSQVRHIILPLQYPDPNVSPQWQDKNGVEVLPVKTHLLGHIDDPVEVIRRYVSPHAQPGDIVTIGESPLAIIQGRWHHPEDMNLSWVARRFPYYFGQNASLATASGLQGLINEVGAWRVVMAFLLGAIAKILGKPGAFYELAGEQARLIDDVTGNLPPYDQFSVLGPANSQEVVERIKRETGLSAAIVDVNDLKAVKILAATPDLSTALLEKALRSNPAGNADEQTPLVLIRPTTG